MPSPVPHAFRCLLARLAWATLTAAYLVLGLAWLLPDLNEHSPAAAWIIFLIRTFSFHAGLAGFICLALAAALRLWKPALVAAPIIAALLLPAAWSARPRTVPPLGPDAITVMSCNLLVGSRSPAAILPHIQSHDPDIILFQEYSRAAHAVLEPALRDRYPHIIAADREHPFGQAIYSRLPPIGEVEVVSGGLDRYIAEAAASGAAISDPQLRIVVDIGGREVVVRNIHTASPQDPGLLATQRAFASRLADDARAETRPIIMGGDLNATPGTPTMRTLADAGLQSTHALAGRGRASTWPAKTFLARLPGVRIDHILLRGRLRCDQSLVLPSIGSDHRTIVARVGF